ncbi:MAG TPA: response regulator transcription factor [Gaiellaceae bacterium]|nr:response regulator transcription factor [Gaiellaceae bacterium]
MSARILVVDDEPALLQGLAYALDREHFDVTTATDGAEALDATRDADFDLIILDLMLPKVSGVEVCRRIRAESPVPIIMLTAKDSEVDKVVGLEVGADDYVTKPFSALELLGRVRAILRRRELDRSDGAAAVRAIGGLRIDFARHELIVDGEPVSLTPSEFKVLYVLAQRPEEVVSKRAILEHLWESTFVGDQHACDVHISNLRRKVERDPSRPERIVTVRGFGYKLMPA